MNNSIAVGYVRHPLGSLSSVYQIGAIQQDAAQVTLTVNTDEDCILVCMTTPGCTAVHVEPPDGSSTNKSCFVY